MAFFQFKQNNSYGIFTVNDIVCHRLFIEADTHSEATKKAEELGCYWDGVSAGIDCPCCGEKQVCLDCGWHSDNMSLVEAARVILKYYEDECEER